MRIYSILLLSLLAALVGRAGPITENFSTDPSLAGWQVFGDTNLYQWNAAHQNLAVTWDSSQTNSFFYHPLGTVCSKTNDFYIAFDVRLNDITIGVTPGNPYSFEIAIGLINTATATSGNFYRGYGEFPNLVEFDYFPNDINDYGATVSTPVISTEINYSGGGFTYPLEMETNTLYHVIMVYTATNGTLHATMTANGLPFGPVEDSQLGTNFDDFNVDAISINSYSDAGQFPGFGGSVLAHGTVDNLTFISPSPTDDFAQDPLQNGWKEFGDTNLFHWNPTNQNVEVTWDSTQTNSYLYRPLGTILTTNNDFSLAFDLQLTDVQVLGFGDEIAIGLCKLSDATRTNYDRVVGADAVTGPRNLFEFDYFPAVDDETISPTMISGDDTGYDQWATDFFFPQLLPNNVNFHVKMTFTATNQTLTTVVTSGADQPYGTFAGVQTSASFAGFQLDTVAISSYDGNSDPLDSTLAHGIVDNFTLILPPPPVQNLAGSISGGQWQAQFLSQSNWVYTLERSADLQGWTGAASVAGNGTNTVIADPATPPDKAFYRIRAERP